MFRSGAEAGIKQQRDELLKEAENARLVRLARAEHPGVTERFLFRAGDTLVAVGVKLTAWYRSSGSPSYFPTFHVDGD